MEWTNAITRKLKITYPVVQAPMLGVTTPNMVAAVANQGGLGSLPVGSLPPGPTADLIRQTKSLTGRPFAVNLFAHPLPPPNLAQLTAMQDFLADFCRENQLPVVAQNFRDWSFYSYHDQIQVLRDENIPIVSFTFGVLDDDTIEAFKSKGVVLIGTATSPAEAQRLAEKEIDIITVQGTEAGGHRGSFLAPDAFPLVGLMALIPRVTELVSQPVLAAGGIYNGATIRAAFRLGAQGVQIGTAFVASHESLAIPAYKATLTHPADTRPNVLTKALSGRWARGLSNRLITAIEQSGLEIPAFPYQTSLTAGIRAAAQQQNDPEFTALWAGQAGAAQMKPAAEIFTQLIRQTEALA